ncbi:MAG: ribonuclease III [Alphaproteobacteria bacterium]|nr:ribonuclease III [Alphaproteobacteria bacterium]MCL2889744.1 ribonuclease III [Alphaproteobacteria bacterium]
MKKINYKFNDEKLLSLALTQSGADAVNNNERLEFLGDRVLGLVVADLLYKMFPGETEGELARRHAMLVSSNTLSNVAAEFGFDKKIKRGHMTGGRLKHIMADAMESTLGAIFIDGGWDAAYKVIAEIWNPLAAADLVAPKDPKTALQELAQHFGDGDLPEYEFLDGAGPTHSPVFNVRVTAVGKSATGTGVSKKSATADAAKNLLEILQ